MSARADSLPEGFEALAPYVAFWAVDTAAGRAQCRQDSDEASRNAFYQAVQPLAAAALEYLDARPLAELDAGEQQLMWLLLSFTHVAMAVELQQEEEATHARDRHFLRITRAPADEPAAVC